MHKLLVFLALLCPIAAFAGDIYNPGYSSIGDYPDVDNPNGSFTPSCTQSGTFLARTSGLSTTERNAYDTMICGMVTDGDWSKIDVLYVFATNNQTTALLNLKSTSFGGTTHGTVSFSADHGYTGDASTFCIDTGYNASTAGLNVTATSAAMGIYVLSSRTTGQAWTGIGVQDGSGTPFWGIFAKFADNNAYAQYNGNAGVAMANAQGQSVAVRTSATAMALWKNNTSVVSNAAATGGLVNVNMSVFCENNGSFNVQNTGDQQSAAFIGSGGINVANVSARINAYMTALGINVY